MLNKSDVGNTKLILWDICGVSVALIVPQQWTSRRQRSRLRITLWVSTVYSRPRTRSLDMFLPQFPLGLRPNDTALLFYSSYRIFTLFYRQSDYCSIKVLTVCLLPVSLFTLATIITGEEYKLSSNLGPLTTSAKQNVLANTVLFLIRLLSTPLTIS